MARIYRRFATVGSTRSPLLATMVAASVIALTAGACNKKADAPRPAAIPSGSGAPAPAMPSAAAPGTPLAADGAKADSGATITGQILLASLRKGDVTPNDVVYLVARRVADNPAARGSLVAVKRYTASSFPIDFTLGAGDMMFKNGAFEGELTLAARVDKDGDPMTRKKGDVFGTVDRVKVGAAGVQLKLDQLQAADESLAGAPNVPTMPGGMPAGHP